MLWICSQRAEFSSRARAPGDHAGGQMRLTRIPYLPHSMEFDLNSMPSLGLDLLDANRQYQRLYAVS